ncbi:MAG: transporter [Candidatus Saccharibacteria bacterium]|nr:transporter [Candidatus Saccharibacteria bacterium]
MKKPTTRQSLRIFWHYTKRYQLLFWSSTVGSVLAVIAQDIIPPYIVAKTFQKLQQAYSNHEALQFSDYSGYFIAFTVSMLLGAALWRIQTYCVWKFEIAVRKDMAIDIYNHLQSQSQRFHADRFGGALVSQTNKFIAGYEKVMDEFVWSITSGVTAFVASLLVLFFISYKYALVLLAVTTVYMIIMTWRMRRQMPFNRAEAVAESNQTAALADAITNTTTIRAFGQEDFESSRFGGIAGNTHKSSMALAVEALKTDSISHAQTNSFHVIAFLFGLVAITATHANVSVLYLIITYTQGLVGRLWQFGRVMRNLNRAIGDSAEMTEILGLEPEIKNPEKPEPVAFPRGTIDFQNVTFYYPEDAGRTPLFKDLYMHIKPGEKVGLVGHSGGGKTTITKLLLRFMDIQEGSIMIDGQDITRVLQIDLRKHIAYVPQEPMLFHRSLRENIRYGSPEATDEQVMAVAKMAHAHEFIEKLSHGYDTLVGERGVKLSGGQRQRVAIARAMLKNAPILVLDEATSALDSESEVLIQDALWKLMEGRTAIVIAHRLSTIQKMDRILVMDKGVIAEEGTHKELIRQNGVYATLWNHQSGGFIEE